MEQCGHPDAPSYSRGGCFGGDGDHTNVSYRTGNYIDTNVASVGFRATMF